MPGVASANYDVTPDGQRFIMFPLGTAAGEVRAGLATFVSSWFEELRDTFAPRR